jgi:hypothetical protein
VSHIDNLTEIYVLNPDKVALEIVRATKKVLDVYWIDSKDRDKFKEEFGEKLKEHCKDLWNI